MTADRIDGGVALPADAPTASADQLPDLRPRPEVSCEGDAMPTDCVAWMYTIPEDVGGGHSVAADDQLLVVRTRQHLRAIDTQTGEVTWEQEDSAPSGRVPRVWLIDELVVATDGATVRTFTRATGEPVAEHQLPSQPLDTTSDDDHLYVALPAAPGHLPPIQAWTMSGTLAWQQALPPTWLELQPSRVLLHVAHDGLLIVDGAFGRRTGTDARVAFHPATGERVPLGTVTDNRPQQAADEVQVVAVGDTLIGRHPRTGQAIWTRAMDTDNLAPVNLSDRYWAISRLDGSDIHIVDTATGQDRLTVRVEGGRTAGFPSGPPWVVPLRTDDGQHLVRLGLEVLLGR